MFARGYVLVVLSLLFVQSGAQQKSAAQVAIEKQIARYSKGMETKNVSIVGSVLDPNFTVVNQRGDTATRKQVIEQLQTMLKELKAVRVSIKIVSFKQTGQNAYLRCKNVIELDHLDAKGATDKIRSETESDEVWVLSGGTYRLGRSKQLSNKVTINGRPIKGG